MEARSAIPIIPTVVDVAAVETIKSETAAPSVRATRGRGRPIARPVPLTREQEYQFIREDMRRLIVIAGGLLALMLVLLVVIER